MDAWLQIVVRQLMLYSLPVIVSLSCTAMFVAWINRTPLKHPFAGIAGRAVWLPLLAAISLHRGIIITGYGKLTPGVKVAATRLLAQTLLCLVGVLLYAWSLGHMPSAGLPPLHHWWAKVLMFFNLCMIGMHLLPLPGQLVGEWLRRKQQFQLIERIETMHMGWLLLTLLAASPLLDLLLGAGIIFPVYESLTGFATHWAE